MIKHTDKQTDGQTDRQSVMSGDIYIFIYLFIFFWGGVISTGDCSLEGWSTLPIYICIFPGHMISYPVKENPINSTVSEILRYKQTDIQTDILLLYYNVSIYLRLLLLGMEQEIDLWQRVPALPR